MGLSTQLKLDYQGSVKNVLSSTLDNAHLWFQFTDDYSVFDWGKMPDTITNKGKSLAVIGTYFFKKLADKNFWSELPNSPHLKKFDSNFLATRWQHYIFAGPSGLNQKGLSSHFVDLVSSNQESLSLSNNMFAQAENADPLMKVVKADVRRPIKQTLFGQDLYFYDLSNNTNTSRRLVPLEIVFRFGMSKGSSLIKRLLENPDYGHILGLAITPVAEQWFDRPIIEFFTKLEPKDRLLSWQEATHISGLNPKRFEELVELSLDIALSLHHIFAEKDLQLWDGKFEFILDNDHLSLADSIGPDELRLIYQNKQLSKELVRQYYRDTSWAKAMQKAQEIAKLEAGRNWKEICKQDLNESPAPLSPPVKAILSNLYGMLANHLTEEKIFPQQPTLKDFVDQLDASEKNLLAHDRKN